jgi:hypothetical protein
MALVFPKPNLFLIFIRHIHGSGHAGHAVDEFRAEKNVSVVEHAVFQGNDDKLKIKRDMGLVFN